MTDDGRVPMAREAKRSTPAPRPDAFNAGTGDDATGEAKASQRGGAGER